MLIIIKFQYNARSDWLKQRTLSENKEQVNDINLAFKSDLTQIKHPLCGSDELFVSRKYGSEAIADNSSVETG